MEHLHDFWAYFAGLPPEHDQAPDATGRGWLRLAIPREDAKRGRWHTDPVWEVIQRANFGQVAPPRPLGRGKTEVHDPDAIYAEIYGLFKVVSVIHKRQMDATLLLEDEVIAFIERAAQVDQAKGRTDFQAVRDKARRLGRSVPLLGAPPWVTNAAE